MNRNAMQLLLGHSVAFAIVTIAYYRQWHTRRQGLRRLVHYVEHELMADLKDPLPGDAQLPHLIVGDEWMIREVGHSIIYRVRIREIHPITVLLDTPKTSVWHKRTEIEWIELVKF